MTPESVLGLVLAVGPYPGGTLYSQTPVSEGAPLVVSTIHQDHGRTFRSFRHLAAGEKAPSECTQRRNVHCRRPRKNATLKRWQRPETYSEGMARYWQIAKAVASIEVLTPAVMDYAVTVFRHESGMFRRDVHEGTNHRPFRSRTTMEDGGLAWGFGQVHWSTLPSAKIPVSGFRELTLGGMVGLDAASTRLGVEVPITRLARIVTHCGATAAACVFTAYGGNTKSSHPLIKARLATYARVRRLGATERALSPAVRKRVGLAPGDAE